MNKRLRQWWAVAVATALLSGGCAEGTTRRSGSSCFGAGQKKSPDGLKVAPESKRVDLEKPTFSKPTEITNPLYPIKELDQVLLLGQVEGKPFRTEVTLLPETKMIECDGKRIETLVSQYVAYLDGRIHEVALDWYAQADDGAVWYFGEDVFNYEDGVVADTEGTWIAGKDGRRE